MAREPGGTKGGSGAARAPEPDVELYVTETSEVDAEVWAAEAACDVEAYIAQAVTVAWRVLEAKGRYDLRRPAPLLAGDTEGDIEAHLAARVILHSQRMGGALRGDVWDVRREAMLFATAVERATHLEAWGRAVVQHRRRDATDRENIKGHNARLRQNAEAFWAPWQKEYRALRVAGWTEPAARQETGGRIVETTGREVDDKTLRKWLAG
jgi:hypothetical protein